MLDFSKSKCRVGRVAQVVERPPSKDEALNSNPIVHTHTHNQNGNLQGISLGMCSHPPAVLIPEKDKEDWSVWKVATVVTEEQLAGYPVVGCTGFHGQWAEL
jgi:hypothetical protein